MNVGKLKKALRNEVEVDIKLLKKLGKIKSYNKYIFPVQEEKITMY